VSASQRPKSGAAAAPLDGRRLDHEIRYLIEEFDIN
jgi:hypothetical protein